ncbi:MAG: hypothetical protein EOM14_03410 [Clostridia bacterium]|nr:hypothetical protein [Clostridia bacterium]
MKSIIIPITLFLILLAGCSAREQNAYQHSANVSSTQDENASSQEVLAYNSVYSYLINKNEHLELDYGVSDHDGLAMIRDFAILPNGNLLLLQFSKNICEYTPDGQLVGIYDLEFEELDLTAYMITCDEEENFYLIDGYNQLVLKANRDGLLHISQLCGESQMFDIGTITSMYATEQDILEITASGADNNSYVYCMDVSGEVAVCIGEPRIGRSIGNGIMYYPSLIYDESGHITNSVELTLYNRAGKSVTYQYFANHKNNAGVYGMVLYGIVDQSNYLGKIFEWRRENESAALIPKETFVKINSSGKIISACITDIKSDSIIRSYGTETYIMQYSENVISVTPLLDLCTDWTNEFPFISN